MRAAKILLIDDSTINQMLSRKIFSQLGYEFMGVKSGKKGLEILKKESFDILLLDLELPDMEGFEIAKYIRSTDSKTNKQLPIIALSGNNKGLNSEDLIIQDITEYLIKPLDYDNLVGLVKQQLLS